MKVKKNKDIPSFAEYFDRAQVSDRAAELLSISLLEDYGMVTRGNSENIIGKNKIRRTRTAVPTALKESQNVSEISSLYFVGQGDTTYFNGRRGDKLYKREVTEEHIAVINEPGNNI